MPTPARGRDDRGGDDDGGGGCCCCCCTGRILRRCDGNQGHATAVVGAAVIARSKTII